MASSANGTMQEPVDPWDKAKARFLEGLGEEEKALFDRSTIEDLYYSASNSERADQKSSRMRAGLQKLQPLMSALEDYGKALDAYANTAALYLAPIWGSIRVILAMASNYGRFYNRMIEAFGRIGDILPRFREYQRIFDGEKHRRFTQALADAYCDIIILCTDFKNLLQRQKKSSLRRVLQPLSPALNESLEEAVERFRKHRDQVDREAEVCHMIEEKEARELVLRNNAAAEARERGAKREGLLSQLSSIDHQYKHRRMRRVRHPGTGSWLTVSAEFRNWLECGQSSTLCCYGIPGSGKSVLVSSLVDDFLSNNTALKTRDSIVFYYCDHADVRTLDLFNIFSCLTQQLLRNHDDWPQATFTMVEDLCHHRERISDFEALCDLLLHALKKTPRATIFLDGLDEISEDTRQIAFHRLRNLMTQAAPTELKLFLSGRDHTVSLTNIPGIPDFKVCIGAQAIAGDVAAYVRHSIRESLHQGHLVLGESSLEEEILMALTEGAKGMFLWVRFQLDELCSAETDAGIRKVLLNLPRDLGETYDRLLSRVDGAERKEYVMRMFRWIISARRPLSMDELREAIAFTIDDQFWDASKIPNDLRRLVRACGNLIVVDEDTHKVQLAHYTVQQYLLDPRERKPSGFHVFPDEADQKLGETCVSYLSFSDFETQISRHVNSTIPTMATLQKAVATQSLLSNHTPGATAAKIMMSLRPRKDDPAPIEFSRYIPPKQLAAVDLAKKYALLSYVTDNWLWHTRKFQGSHGQTHIRLFNKLVCSKTLLFSFRPWDAVPQPSGEYAFAFQIGWALKLNHIALLQAIKLQDNHEICVCFSDFCIFFENNVDPAWLYSLQLKLYEIDYYSDIQFPSADDWKGWLHYQCLVATRQGHAAVIDFVANELHNNSPYGDRWRRCFGHMILQAATHSQTTVFQRLLKEEYDVLTLASGLSNGWHFNALDHAILCGYQDGINILQGRMKISPQFHKYAQINGLDVQDFEVEESEILLVGSY